MDKIQGGEYNTITLDQVISSAKTALGIETSDYDIFFEKISNEAVRHLDCLSTFVKSFAVLTIADGRAPLPQGYHSLIGLRFKKQFSLNGLSQLTNGSNTLNYVDSPFLDETALQSYGNNLGDGYQIQGGCIYFSQNIFSNTQSPISPLTPLADPLEGVQLILAYFGLNIDEDGLFVVLEDYERAITAYVCWKYAQQMFDKYPANLREEFRAEWAAQKKWLKGNDVRDHFEKNKRAMASTMHAIINAKTWTV